jgi:hypothetical protein
MIIKELKEDGIVVYEPCWYEGFISGSGYFLK